MRDASCRTGLNLSSCLKNILSSAPVIRKNLLLIVDDFPELLPVPKATGWILRAQPCLWSTDGWMGEGLLDHLGKVPGATFFYFGHRQKVLLADHLGWQLAIKIMRQLLTSGSDSLDCTDHRISSL